MATRGRTLTATRRRTRKRKKAVDEELALPLPLGAGILGGLLLVAALLGAVFITGLYVDAHYLRVDAVHDPKLQELAKSSTLFADATMGGFFVGAALFVSLGILSRRRWAWASYLLLTCLNLAEGIAAAILQQNFAHGVSAGISLLILIYWIRPAVSEAFV